MPQLLFLRKHGLFQTLCNDVMGFLSSNPGIPYSSHEILNSIINSSGAVQTLCQLLSTYKGGFAEVASHIGAISSYLSCQQQITHTTKICSVLNKSEDAFSM